MPSIRTSVLILAFACPLIGQQAVWKSTGARQSGAGTFDMNRNTGVVFGGSSGASFLNDTWERLNGGRWQEPISGNNQQPPPRSGHSLIYMSSSKQVILFGGVTKDPNNPTKKKKLRDVWVRVSGSKCDSSEPRSQGQALSPPEFVPACWLVPPASRRRPPILPHEYRAPPQTGLRDLVAAVNSAFTPRTVGLSAWIAAAPAPGNRTVVPGGRGSA